MALLEFQFQFVRKSGKVSKHHFLTDLFKSGRVPLGTAIFVHYDSSYPLVEILSCLRQEKLTF